MGGLLERSKQHGMYCGRRRVGGCLIELRFPIPFVLRTSFGILLTFFYGAQGVAKLMFKTASWEFSAFPACRGWLFAEGPAFPFT